MIRLNENNMFPRKTMIQFSVIFAATILIICTVTYTVLDSSISNKINILDMQNLKIFSRSVEARVDRMESTAIRVITDDVLKKSYSELKVEEIMYIIHTLLPKVHQETDYYSVMLFYAEEEKYLGTQSKNNPNLGDYYLSNAPLGLNGVFIPEEDLEAENMIMMKGFPVIGEREHGALVVGIKAKTLFDVEKEEGILVIDEEGNLIFGEEKSYEQLSQSDKYQELIKKNEETQKIKINDHVFVVSVFASESDNWKYLRIHDAKDFYSVIDFLRNSLITVAVISLLLGICAYYWAIRKTHLPISQMLSKLSAYQGGATVGNEFDALDSIVENILKQKEVIQELYDNSKSFALSGVVLKLYYGNFMQSEEELIRKQLEDQGFFVENREFSAFVIRIKEFRKKADDLELLSHSLESISANVVLAYLKEDYIIGIISCKDEFEQVIQYVDAIRCHVNNRFGVEAYIGVGNPCHYLTSLHLSFQEAFDALKYRRINENSPIIHINDCVYNRKNTVSAYSFEKEEKLFKCIKNEDIENAEEIVDEMCGMIYENAELTDIPYLIWQILNGVFRCLGTMGLQYEEIVLDGEKDFENFKALLSFEEMVSFVKGRIREIIKYLVEKRTTNNGVVALKIKKYIEEHYDEPLSLDFFSQMMKLTPAYISQIFKVETGTNIKTYITDVRLERARSLICDTHLTFEAITAKIGYENSRSFYRAFRNKYGVPPSSFRKEGDQSI